MQTEVEKIIIAMLKELNEELENESLQNPSLETRLFGGRGVLDSLALVSFITDVEDAIDEAFDKQIVLADEKAMSQKTSPFRSVETLRDYVVKLLNE
jgi:acyl carrier protein